MNCMLNLKLRDLNEFESIQVESDNLLLCIYSFPGPEIPPTFVPPQRLPTTPTARIRVHQRVSSKQLG